MKKGVKKLVLAKETLRNLNRELLTVQGGTQPDSFEQCGDTLFANCTDSVCGPCPNIDVPQSVGGFC
jgi:hypothetical protein